ncbi:hypothetical protein AALA52_06190 [Lactococcus ileimucosae]|uniref:Phytase-like domain-containing protein n=1 Tax=Lactococcus ileimucosae TaxID=2941329 RepID=A0ABV4D2V0_9LACT
MDTSGTPRAFSLSLADVTRFSGQGRAFPNPGDRLAHHNNSWLLRTPTGDNRIWIVDSRWFGSTLTATGLDNSIGIGPRPALIINQAN